MEVALISNRVLVEREAIQEKTDGGIIIPEKARKQSRKGTVAGLGQERVLKGGKTCPFEVKEGDTVLFNASFGVELKIDERDLLVFKEEELLGIVE